MHPGVLAADRYYRRNVTSGACGTTTTNVIHITVGAALTGATFTGSGDACFGAISTIKSVITGGAPPYILTITGYPLSPVAGYISNTNISLGSLSVGPHTYTLATVKDACGNSINPNINYTININGIPNIAGTIPASQSICSDGTASITLNSTVNNTIFAYTVASVPAAGYTWTAGKNPVAGSITDADGNGTETLTRQLQHNNNAAVVVTYTITPTGPGATACPGTAITRTVTVNPVPAITAMTATICSGGSFTSTPVNDN